MGQTRVDIYPEVVHKTGLPTNDRMMTEEKVYRDINAGLRKMAMDFDWPWLRAIETISFDSDENYYVLPAEYVKTRWVAIDEFPLKSVQDRELVRLRELHGEPKAFTYSAGGLLFYPKPNAAVSITHAFVRGETYLADDSDEVLCPDTMIDVVYTYAALQSARRMKDAVLINSLNDEISVWKRRSADVNKPSKGTFAPQIGRVW